MPLGQGLTKESFLLQSVVMNMDEFVNWGAGTAHFDTGGFAQLLEFANTLPVDFDWGEENWFDPDELIASGRQIVMQHWVNEFLMTQRYAAIFGGEIVFKGFPTESRNGNVLSIGSGLAMTTRCANKDGAWAFMRTILTEDWQRENSRWSFPTNRVVFDEILADAMHQEYFTDEEGNQVPIPKMSFQMARPMPAGGAVVSRSSVVMGGSGDDGMISIYALTQAQADQIMALINSVSGTFNYDEALLTIIREGAADFFTGRSSAQDAARIIQSRASIYVAEQR
jgi:ABC-type glycerol-3-phosphate transport system substrate-binding protein